MNGDDMKRLIALIALLVGTNACAAVTGIKTPPGGANTQVQFNDHNVFGSSNTFTFSKTSGLLSTPHVEADTMTVYGAQEWRDQKAPAGNFFVHDFDNYITLTPSYVDADNGNILQSTCSLTQPRAWTIGSYNKDSTESNVWSMGANNNVINFTRTYLGTQQSYFGVGYQGYTIVNSSGVHNLSGDGKATFMIFGSTPIGDPLLGIYGDNGENQLGPTKIQTLLFQVHQSSISAMEPLLVASSATVHGQLQAGTLKFPDGTTQTTAATGTGNSPFTNATSSTSLNLNGFAINNSSAVTTSSMSVTGATITVNGTAFCIIPRSEISGTAIKLFQYDPITNAVTFPDAITTGVTTGGTVGSTTTMTSRIDLQETRMHTGTSPTLTASVAGEFGFYTTDGMMALTDGTTTYGIATATDTFSVLLSSMTGNGSGGWDSLTWTFPSPATYPIYIRSVWASCIGGTSVSLNLDARQANFTTDTGGTNIFKSSTTINASGWTKIIDLQNQLISPGSVIVLKTPSSASSGSVNRVAIGLNYSKVVR